MKKPFLSLAAVCGLLLALVPASQAAPKDYQVTGPIVSMTDTTIVVKKGTETWELAKDATLKPADGSALKVGDKVTVHYTMAATSVETKKDAAKGKGRAQGEGGGLARGLGWHLAPRRNRSRTLGERGPAEMPAALCFVQAVAAGRPGR